MYILYHLFLKIVSLSQSFYTSSIPSPLFIFTFFFIYTKTHCLYSDEVESTGLKPMGSLAEPFWSGHHNRRLFLEILTLFIEHYYIFYYISTTAVGRFEGRRLCGPNKRQARSVREGGVESDLNHLNHLYHV